MKALLKALFVKGLVQFGISTGLKSKAPKYILLKILAGFLFLVAGIFTLVAVHQLLLEHFSHPAVNLIFATVFILAGIVILTTVTILRDRRKNDSPIETPLRILDDLGSRAQVQAKELGHQAEVLVQRHSGKVLLGVAIASLIIGRRSAKK